MGQALATKQKQLSEIHMRYLDRTYRWTSGGNQDSNHVCEGKVIWIIPRGESLLTEFPRSRCGWPGYIRDVSERYDRAVCRPTKIGERKFFIVQLDKLTCELR